MWPAPLLLAIALFQPGDAVILEIPSPGFGSGIPHTVQINVYDSALAFRSSLPSPPSDGSSAFVFAPNGDLFITEPFAVARYDAAGTRVGVFARFSTTPTLLAFDYGDLIVAGGGTCDLARIDSAGKQVACVNVPQPDSLLDLDIASDGCHALISTVHGLEIVDLCAGDGTAIPTAIGPPDVYLGARFLPDGNILATRGVSANSAVEIDVIDGRGRLIRHLYDVSGVAAVTLDPDGRTLWVVDGATLQRIAVENGVRIVAPSRLVHGSESRRISVRAEWRAATSRSRLRAVAH